MNKKQIERKSNEFVRMLRLYQIGFVDAKQVRNTLNCLFVDVMLDETTKDTKRKLNIAHGYEKDRFFNQLMEEMTHGS